MNLLSSKRLFFTMNHYCFPSTKSTAISTKQIKQFFSDLGFLCSFFFLLFFSILFKLLPFISTLLLLLLALIFSFFSGANFSSLMENLRPRFEALDEEYHDIEFECFVDSVGVESASAAPFQDHEKWQENPDEEDRRSEENPDGKARPGVANHKEVMELNSSSMTFFNGGSHAQHNPIFKTYSFRHYRTDTNYENFHASSEHHSQQPTISHTLSDLGSDRKEREWRKTLACKLFQERHNVAGGDGSAAGGGGEGMDMLWEAYERTEEENKGNQREISEEKSKKNKSRIVDYLEELEEEEAEEVNLCCLKALKFSAGKMHFGMARPGFLSFSKAVKAIRAGWSKQHHHHHRKKKV